MGHSTPGMEFDRKYKTNNEVFLLQIIEAKKTQKCLVDANKNAYGT